MYRITCSEIWGGIESVHENLSTPGMVAAVHSSSAKGAKGGDIYYLSVCDSDLLTRIVIADVVGHGESVSQMSEFVYDCLRTHMNDLAGAEVLMEVNAMVAAQGIQAMTTAAVAAYYKPDNAFYISYAGHHPALVKRSDDSEWQELEVSNRNETSTMANLPLGIFPETRYTQESTTLRPGDKIIMYTDGLTEARDQNGDQYGPNRQS